MSAAATDVEEITKQAIAVSNAIGKHYGFEEARTAVTMLLLDEVGAGRDKYVTSLIARVQRLPNPNVLPG